MQIDLFFIFWLVIVILPIALAPVFIVLLEKRKIKMALKEIYSSLKEKSQKVRIDNTHSDTPKIVAELNPEWQIDRVEVSSKPIGTFTYSSRFMFFLPRKYLNIVGIKGIRCSAKFAITGRDPLSATIADANFRRSFQTGDLVFDRKYLVKGEDNEAVLKVLSDSEFRRYISGIYDLIKFEVKGDENVNFVVKCNPDIESFENSILAMKRVIKLMAEN